MYTTSIRVPLSDEEKAAIDEYCNKVGMTLAEHMRRGSRLYRRLIPDKEIVLRGDMSSEEWDIIKWRLNTLQEQVEEQGDDGGD
jgi:hypothetical protein